MIIIQDNPEQVIPQICERYASEKVILIELFGNASGTEYIGLLVKDLVGQYRFEGNCIYDIVRKDKYTYFFTDGRNGLYETILYNYNLHADHDLFKVRFYVFDNSHEIIEYFKVKGIL
jgi:hypothetical protein